MKGKGILTLLVLAATLGSCSLFKPRCHCPSFGAKKVEQRHNLAAKTGNNPSDNN